MKDKDIIQMLYKLDWIKILDKAIKGRPSSWYPRGFEPIEFETNGKKWKEDKYSPAEWRNSSDTICDAVVNAIKKELKCENKDGVEKIYEELYDEIRTIGCEDRSATFFKGQVLGHILPKLREKNV